MDEELSLKDLVDMMLDLKASFTGDQDNVAHLNDRILKPLL